jgi:hypothetical protein
MAVCDSARAQPARTAAASAADAATQAIEFTRFMQENSTHEPATKIKAGNQSWPLLVRAGILDR